MIGDNFQAHPSYGLAQFVRTSIGGGGIPLFGSSIQHANVIALTVHKAQINRDLHNDWFHPRESLLEIWFSSAQFAELLTTMNMGVGAPCTIRYTEREGEIEHEPEEGKRVVFDRETAEKVSEVAKRLDAVIEMAEKTKASVALKKAIGLAKQEIMSNMPFLLKQFQKQMDKTVTEAKAEVEEFVSSYVTRTGIQALKEQSAKMLPGGKHEIS